MAISPGFFFGTLSFKHAENFGIEKREDEATLTQFRFVSCDLQFGNHPMVIYGSYRQQHILHDALQKGELRIQVGQVIARSHDLGPQKVAEEGTSPYFRDI